jgi:hypothetical protein
MVPVHDTGSGSATFSVQSFIFGKGDRDQKSRLIESAKLSAMKKSVI